MAGLRSFYVLEPGTWGTMGGAIDQGETPVDTVTRECFEEAGYTGKLDLRPMVIFSHPSGFRYSNFIAVVDDEFEPELNHETQCVQWFDLGEAPSPLHPGLEFLLNHSGDAIRDLRAEVYVPAPARHCAG